MKTLAIFFHKKFLMATKNVSMAVSIDGNKRPDQNETRGRVERHGGLHA